MPMNARWRRISAGCSRASTNIKIESGQVPQAVLPEVEARLQPAEMRLHRAFIGIVAQGDGLPVGFPTPKPVQRAFGEGCQLAIDRDPLAGTFPPAGSGPFPPGPAEATRER